MMSEQNLDYAAIRRNVDKRLSRQKWLYRIVFLVMHILFYLVTMLLVWNEVGSNVQLSSLLFSEESSALLVVLLPSIMWGTAILFHIASIFFETRTGEKAMRNQLLMREVGENIMRTGETDDAETEKPKRHALSLEEESVDEDEPLQQNDYNARPQRR
jgi:hypothetical protein